MKWTIEVTRKCAITWYGIFCGYKCGEKSSVIVLDKCHAFGKTLTYDSTKCRYKRCQECLDATGGK